MTALAAEFFTLDEVNRLKIIQDVIDWRLTTQMAAQRLGISAVFLLVIGDSCRASLNGF